MIENRITLKDDKKKELHALLQEGLNDVVQGNSRPFSEAMITLRNHRKKQNRGTLNG